MIELLFTSEEEPLELVEEVLEYDINDIYMILVEISEKLDKLQETGTGILQLLQSSFLDSLAALLLILVGFEIMRLVRGWTKGERFIGRNS